MAKAFRGYTSQNWLYRFMGSDTSASARFPARMAKVHSPGKGSGVVLVLLGKASSCSDPAGSAEITPAWRFNSLPSLSMSLGEGYTAVSLGWLLSHQVTMTQQWQGPAPCWVSFLSEPFSLKEVLSAVAQGLFIDGDKYIFAGRLMSSHHSHHHISSRKYWLIENANF